SIEDTYYTDEDLISDFHLIIHNAKMVHMPNSKIYKAAVLLEKRGNEVIVGILELSAASVASVGATSLQLSADLSEATKSTKRKSLRTAIASDASPSSSRSSSSPPPPSQSALTLYASTYPRAGSTPSLHSIKIVEEPRWMSPSMKSSVRGLPRSPLSLPFATSASYPSSFSLMQGVPSSTLASRSLESTLPIKEGRSFKPPFLDISTLLGFSNRFVPFLEAPSTLLPFYFPCQWSLSPSARFSLACPPLIFKFEYASEGIDPSLGWTFHTTPLATGASPLSFLEKGTPPSPPLTSEPPPPISREIKGGEVSKESMKHFSSASIKRKCILYSYCPFTTSTSLSKKLTSASKRCKNEFLPTHGLLPPLASIPQGETAPSSAYGRVDTSSPPPPTRMWPCLEEGLPPSSNGLPPSPPLL
ncbi:hypothetical protein IE077_003879, partial [Cardiosporidium cionae]